MVWHQLLPGLTQVSPRDGQFSSSLPIRIHGMHALGREALERINRAAERITGYPQLYALADQRAADQVGSHVDGRSAVTGGYRIEISGERIVVAADTHAAAANALATITQAVLLASGEAGDATPTGRREIVLPCVRIDDAPVSSWRGVMVDVARHFFPATDLESFLDIVWLYRLNRLHLHLTDDQGWRFPIAAYPRLTAVGGFRDDNTTEFGTYGGAYTRGELLALDRNAAMLGVTLVPEIDLPGHASAAVTAYPGVGCSDTAPGVQTRWGIHHNLLCIEQDEAREFLRETYAAVADTFAGPYIHIGGDEVPDEAWNQCAACATLDAPYQHTIRWMTETIVALGKRPVAWDEAASLDLPGETIIINWRRPEDAAAALQRGYDIVLAPERKAAYLDHQHLDAPEEPGRLGVCTVADSAGFSPSSYLDQGSATILGGQANIWTEEITVRRSLEYMAYVRLAVIADGLWLGRSAAETAGWEQRVDQLRLRLFARGYCVYPGLLGGANPPPKKHIIPD